MDELETSHLLERTKLAHKLNDKLLRTASLFSPKKLCNSRMLHFLSRTCQKRFSTTCHAGNRIICCDTLGLWLMLHLSEDKPNVVFFNIL